MNAAPPIDIARLIRIVTLLFAAFAGTMLYLAYEPQAEAFQVRIDDAQAQLRSDDVAVLEIPRLLAERGELARRYERAFAQNAQGVFLRELAAIVRRDRISLTTTSVAADGAERASDSGHMTLFSQTRVTLELQGSYRNLLAAIADLSLGPAIVAVDAPSLRREREAISASVPVTIYEPARASVAAVLPETAPAP